MSEQNTIRWEKDADGIVILTLDDPSQSANTMNAAYVKSMRAALGERVVGAIDGASIGGGLEIALAC